MVGFRLFDVVGVIIITAWTIVVGEVNQPCPPPDKVNTHTYIYTHNYTHTYTYIHIYLLINSLTH